MELITLILSGITAFMVFNKKSLFYIDIADSNNTLVVCLMIRRDLSYFRLKKNSPIAVLKVYSKSEWPYAPILEIGVLKSKKEGVDSLNGNYKVIISLRTLRSRRYKRSLLSFSEEIYKERAAGALDVDIQEAHNELFDLNYYE